MAKLILIAAIILAALGYYVFLSPKLQFNANPNTQEKIEEVNTQATKISEVSTTVEDDLTALEKELDELESSESGFVEEINNL